MDVGASLGGTPTTGLLAGVRRLATAPIVLAAVVSLSSLLHVALAWRRPTPGYYPDEYMYAELGRSLAETGSPLVRGEAAHFLPLLYPLVTAPAWLLDDVEHAYRAIQGLNAVAMSLAAIPVFLLARRLRVGEGLALVAAALAVLLPELMYTSALTAEPLAYPLGLAAATAAVTALERPLLRYQVAFLAFSGLAALSRLQLVVLPLCYAAAVVLTGARGRRLRATVREQWLAVGALGLGLALVLSVVVALGGRLGLYGELLAYRVEGGAAVKAFGVNSLVLAYALGWVLIPGALLGIGLALARPRSVGENAFGAFTTTLVALLLVQASAFGDSGHVQERYAIYALPLLAVAFVLFASRGLPHLPGHLLLAGGLAAAAAAVPLAGYAAGGGTNQSLVLVSVARLEQELGDVGLASLLVAAGATAASALVLAAVALQARLATGLAVCVAGAAAVAMTLASFSYYQHSRGALRDSLLPRDVSWVDTAAAERPVTLLLASRYWRSDVHTTLFWNRSVDRLALLPGTEKPDPFAVLLPRVDGAGRLELPRGRLLLADTYGAWLSFRNAERVASAPTKTLWQPAAGPQLAAVLTGRYYNGALAADGAIRAWPQTPGARLSAWLELRLAAPRGSGPVPLELDLPGDLTLRRSFSAGTPQLLRIPVCASGPWKASFQSPTLALVQGNRVGLVAAAEPRLVDDPAACA
jgi:hypothetical protein